MYPMPTPQESVIELRSVEKAYPTPGGPVLALRGVELTIDRAEVVAVVGPSGSGKSTLLHLLAAIDRPTRGEVTVEGTAVHALTEAQASVWRGASIGIVFQFFQLLPTLTALENVLLPMDFLGRLEPKRRPDRARALLARVGVEDQADKLPQTLSGGQQQRVAIARALANDPRVVLADEPTGNLDSASSAAVLDLFAELAADGRSVVIVTHERDIANVAHRTITLVDGRVRHA